MKIKFKEKNVPYHSFADLPVGSVFCFSTEEGEKGNLFMRICADGQNEDFVDNNALDLSSGITRSIELYDEVIELEATLEAEIK